MRLECVVDETIPGLAYAARVRGDRVDVVHGARVEVAEDFLTDGVWSGDFAAGRFDEGHLAGTGLMVRPGLLRVVSSSTPSDRVLISTDGDDIVLSNSLPFLLEVLGDRLDPGYLYYRNRFIAADSGLAIAPHSVPTAGGRRIRTLLGQVADIDASGTMRVELRRSDPPFASFAAYRDHLAESLRALIANAGSEHRAHPLRPLGTMSSGYDSTASSVLVSEAGVTDFATMVRYEGQGEDRVKVDHPELIADRLGVSVREVERGRWKDRDDLPDAEIAAAGVTFMDVVWLTLEDQLDGRLLLTGNFGDNVWDKNDFRIHDDISQAFGTFDNRGFPEWRLRAGFVFCGVPSIGHSAKASLHRISNSEEMAPWSVGGSYDRPIPRRIAEEAGIGRGDFATRKFGGSGQVGTSRSHYPWGPREQMISDLTEVMTRRGAASFVDFCMDHGASGHRWSYAAGRVGTFAYHKLDALNVHVGRRLHRRGIIAVVPRRAMALLASRYKTRLDHTYLWPHWGTEVLRPRYAAAAARLHSAAAPRG
jgi:hypothetical protein